MLGHLLVVPSMQSIIFKLFKPFIVCVRKIQNTIQLKHYKNKTKITNKNIKQVTRQIHTRQITRQITSQLPQKTKNVLYKKYVTNMTN